MARCTSHFRTELLPLPAEDGEGVCTEKGRVYYSHRGSNLQAVRRERRRINCDKAVTGAIQTAAALRITARGCVTSTSVCWGTPASIVWYYNRLHIKLQELAGISCQPRCERPFQRESVERCKEWEVGTRRGDKGWPRRAAEETEMRRGI